MMLANTMNPFNLNGFALPPPLVMSARTLSAAILLQRERPFEIHLPFLTIFDSVGNPSAFHRALDRLAVTGSLLTLFTPMIRTGAALTGCAFLTGLLACKPRHSVAHTYLSCVLIMISLSSHATNAALVRAQLVMLYAGTALNKTLDPDWWNGRYFETVMIDRHRDRMYTRAAAMLPERWLSTTVGISTILLQWSLCACFLFSRLVPLGIVIGAVFHGALLLIRNARFGPFSVAMMASFAAIAPWPAKPPRLRAGWRETSRWIASRPEVHYLMTAAICCDAFAGLLRRGLLVALGLALAPLAGTAVLRSVISR